MSPVEIYKAKFGDVRGFFVDEDIAVRDFFLGLQHASAIVGNFLEIGVLDGKSAYLGALHLAPDESCLLVDCNNIGHVAAGIADSGLRPAHIVQGRSDSPSTERQLDAFRGSVRFFHIDGSHTGFATLNDLRMADRFLGDRGIICVDDFPNRRYPQLIAAVYKFLFDNDPIYKMVLCGINKCFIVRAADYTFYESAIRTHLLGHLKIAGHDMTLSKSSYAHDMGCFSILHKWNGLDHWGLDDDPSYLPF
jgi:Methyltransferase domain